MPAMPEVSLLMAFLAGLMGGVHCLGMCGGIVAAMGFQGGAAPRLPVQAGYNLGRLASYTLAGALAGLAGSAAVLSERFVPAQMLLYVLAQLMLILVGLYLAGLNQAVLRIERLGGGFWRYVQPMVGRLFPVDCFAKALLAGGLWGWLPCGLVYSVLVSALATMSAAKGAALMFAFGLGTLPNLLAMGWAAERLRALFRRPGVRLLAGLAVAGFGVWGLLGLAFRG
jgi:sulfite exporter TauE/SafE